MEHLIVSDIHENFNNLKICLKYCNIHGIKKGFVLGDLINPGIVHMLGRSGVTFTIVLGNNDGDKVELVKAVYKYKNLSIFDVFANIKGKTLLIHYHDLAKSLAKSGDYKAIFYGHNHQLHNEKVGKTLLFNPGELSGHLFGRATFGIWDDKTNTARIYEIVEGNINVKNFSKNSKIVCVNK